MRNLKKFLAVILAIAVMATTMVPAFAAEDYTYEYEADALYDLGLIAGDASGDLALGRDLTRKEGITIVLKLFGYDPADLTDAEIDEALAGFADVEAVKGTWFEGWAAVGVDAGLIAGTVSGNINPDGPFSGKQMATLILKVLGYEPNYNVACAQLAKVNGLTAELVLLNDVDLTRDQAFGMMFAALKAEDVDGVTIADMLIAMDIITIDQAVAYGLVAIASVEDIKATVIVGEDYTLPEKATVVYADGTKGTVAVTWEDDVVDTSEVGVFTFEGTIAGYAEVVIATITVEADSLEVKSVAAANLKEVEIKFSAPVDKDTVSADTIKLNKDLSSAVVVNFSFKDDDKTVVATVDGPANGLENQTKYILKINGVKDINGNALKVEKAFTSFDGTLPELSSVKVTGPRSIEVEFSEPIKEVGSVSIKTGSSTLSVNTAGITSGARKLSIPMYSTFADGKEYTLNISGFKDYAGYANVAYSDTFTYTKDVTPPTASVESASQEKVVVTFNKPVKGLTKDHFSHTFTAWKSIKVTTTDDVTAADITTSQSVSKVYVWFYKDGTNNLERPIAEGTTNFRIWAKNDAGTAIKDEWDNAFATVDIPVTVSADKAAPEVKSIEVNAETSLKVVFTKNVTFGKDNVEVLAADGAKIDGVNLSVTANSASEYIVNFGKNLAGKSILVNIKNVEDKTLSGNKLTLYSTTLDVTDKTPPTVTGARVDITTNSLYVFFDEAVDSTALVAGNYYLVNTALNPIEYIKLTGATEYYTSDKTVKIVLTDAQELKVVPGTSKLFVSGVKDTAGNEIAPNLSGVIDVLSGYVPAMQKVEATGTHTVEVTFNQELSTIAKEAFKVNSKTAEVGIAAMEVTLTDEAKTKAILTLTDDAKVTANTTGVNVVVTNGSLIKNMFGVAAASDPAPEATKAIADKIKPEVSTIAQTAGAKTITVTFTEPVYTTNNAYAAMDFIVKDPAGKTLTAGFGYSVNVTGSTAVITITSPVSGTYNVSTVAEPNYIFDAAVNADNVYDDGENKIAAIDETDVVIDATAPYASVPAAGADNSLTKLVITYSEALYNSGVAVADEADLAAKFTPTGTTAITTATYNAAAKTVTFVIATAAAGDTITVAGTITDQFGNAVGAAYDVATAGAASWTLD